MTHLSLSKLAAPSGTLPKRTGRGSHCGRGNNGQNSRSGGRPPRGFEGGQTPIWKRFPQLSKSLILNSSQPKPLALTLNRLQHLIDIGRIEANLCLITPEVLHSAGLRGFRHGLYVSGSESSYFRTEGLQLIGSFFDKSAIEQLKRHSGFPLSVYLNENGWRGLSNPVKFKKLAEQHERLPPPSWKERIFYSSYENRGYLNETIQNMMPEQIRQYINSHFVLIPEVKHEKDEILIKKAKEILKM